MTGGASKMLECRTNNTALPVIGSILWLDVLFLLIAYKLRCLGPNSDCLSTLELRQQMEVIPLNRLRKRHVRITIADSGNRSDAVVLRIW